MSADTMRQRFATVTNDLLRTEPRTALALADIGGRDFDLDSDRVFNVGIREQALIGITAGLSLSGLRPIAHSYTPFLIERPFEQIKLDLGHQDLGGVLVSIGASYDAAAEGRTHQSPGDVALMSTLPDWTIHVPGHPDEVEAMLRQAALTDGRVYIRLAEDTNSRPYPVTGVMERITTGTPGSPTVIAVGPMLDSVLAAAAGLDLTVLYTSTIRPFDDEGLRAAVAGADVVLVEPYLEGTSVDQVSRALIDHPHRLLAIGVPNSEHRHYGSRREHAAAHLLDARGIRSRIDRFLASAA